VEPRSSPEKVASPMAEQCEDGPEKGKRGKVFRGAERKKVTGGYAEFCVLIASLAKARDKGKLKMERYPREGPAGR